MKQIKVSAADMGELAVILPFQLGFQPESSLVVVCLQGRISQLVARFDLVADSRSAAQVAAQFLTSVGRAAPASALFVAYERAGGESRPLVEAMGAALGSVGIPVGQSVVVSDGRWRCALDDDCSRDGEALKPPADVPAIADFVGTGRAVLPSRDALVDLVRPLEHGADPARTAAVLTRRRDYAAARLAAVLELLDVDPDEVDNWIGDWIDDAIDDGEASADSAGDLHECFDLHVAGLVTAAHEAEEAAYQPEDGSLLQTWVRGDRTPRLAAEAARVLRLEVDRARAATAADSAYRWQILRDECLAAWGGVLRGEVPVDTVGALVPSLVGPLADKVVRDAVISWLAPDPMPLDLVEPDILDSLEDLLGPELCGAPAVAGGRRTAATERTIELGLQTVCRATPAPFATDVLAMAASFAWSRGEGPMAGVCIGEALTIDPKHALSGLLDLMVTNGLTPSEVGRSQARAA
jgi:hypothetical protein